MRRFKVYTPSGGQKGGTLFKFTSLSSPSPFLGTWGQLQRQRGAGLSTDRTGGGKQGVKRQTSDVIRKRSNRRRQDIFGV